MVGRSNFVLNFARESPLGLQQLEAVNRRNKQKQYIPHEKLVGRPQRFH
jgi:hypothetical protein